MNDRRYEVNQRAQSAIRILRDAEDWALLEVGDFVLAARFRECYECITERVLNGQYGRGLSRRKLNDIAQWVDSWAWDNLPQRTEYNARLDEGPRRIGGVDYHRRAEEVPA